MRNSVILLFLLFLSCSTRSDKIVNPTIGASFYSDALVRIDRQLNGDEDNLQLVSQKMYYCEVLEWPSTCIGALDEYKRQKGMTPQLLDQYIDYYTKHQDYSALRQVVERWVDVFDLGNKYEKIWIKSLVEGNMIEQSAIALRNYLARNNNIDDLVFGAESFLKIQDTLMAVYMISKIAKERPSNHLVYNEYPEILYSLNHKEKAYDLFEEKAENDSSFDFYIDLASKYEDDNNVIKAVDKLSSFAYIDTIAYKISDMLAKELKWDSAHYYLDQIIEKDSVNKDAWFKKASLYENRGWLSTSLNYFEHVVYLSPNDTIAAQRADLVRRKIAYLQRLKFEESKIPLLEVESKKILDND